MPHPHPHASRADASLLAAWLGESPQPSAIAIIWRLWLPHARACALLGELHRSGAPVSAMGLIGERGVRLYLWQRALAPGLSEQLLTYDPTAILVDAEQIDDGPEWACGRALLRLLAARARTTET
jgi:hypothetical protein